MATIQGIYVALFGRPADPAGLAYWTTQTQNGLDLGVMLTALPSEAEYTSRFEGMTDTQIINSIFQALYGRDADAGGLEFYLVELASGAATIATIAVHVLNGAKDADLALIEAKIDAADLFTARLDLEAETEAYVGDQAAQIGRDFLDGVTVATPATNDSTDAAILLLLNEGQTPVDGGAPGGGGSFTTFTVSVDDDGLLQFGGNATGAVAVDVNDYGALVFTRGGVTRTLSSEAEVQGLRDPAIELNAADDGDSSVLAFDGEGWQFVKQEWFDWAQSDALDFYAAVGEASSILLLSSFDVEEVFINGVPAGVEQIIDVIAEMGVDGDDLWTVLSELMTTENLSVFATAEANTSLNGLITEVATYFGYDVEELPFDLPNVGLPIVLTGEATELSADGDTGFTLVGAVLSEDATLAGGTGDDILVAVSSGTDYTLLGGAGDDIIAGGNGADVIVGGEGSNILLGGGGADAFVFSGGATGANTNFDTVYDFIPGADRIELRNFEGADLSFEDFEGGTELFVDGELAVVFMGANATGVLLSSDFIDFTPGSLNLNDGDPLKVPSTDGDDVLVGTSGIVNDIAGNSGNDTITGGDLGDLLLGGPGDDVIYGGAGADDIFGGGNNDIINGGSGSDTLQGDKGDDVFVFDYADLASGPDTIQKFNAVGVDTILLVGYEESDITTTSDGVSTQILSGGVIIVTLTGVASIDEASITYQVA